MCSPESYKNNPGLPTPPHNQKRIIYGLLNDTQDNKTTSEPEEHFQQ